MSDGTDAPVLRSRVQIIGIGTLTGAVAASCWLALRLKIGDLIQPTELQFILMFGMLWAAIEVPLGAAIGTVAGAIVALLRARIGDATQRPTPALLRTLFWVQAVFAALSALGALATASFQSPVHAGYLAGLGLSGLVFPVLGVAAMAALFPFYFCR